MEKQDVIAILEALANGNDPATAQPVACGMLQEPRTIRALFTAARLLREADAADPRRRRNTSDTFASAGTPWTQHEEVRLKQEFEQGLSVAQMGLQHGRSSNAIKLRLIKLHLIDPLKPAVPKAGAQTAS